MFAYDVDGDGDNDVITSLAAHDFGLAWYEQIRDGDATKFRQHLIMGDRPEQNRYGVVFSEPHSVKLADIDGDGLKDIITGKTYYSHHKTEPDVGRRRGGVLVPPAANSRRRGLGSLQGRRRVGHRPATGRPRPEQRRPARPRGRWHERRPRPVASPRKGRSLALAGASTQAT